MVSFDDAVAVVTGGGSGIGQTTALEFADRGTSVVVADVDVEGGEKTVADIEATGGGRRLRRDGRDRFGGDSGDGGHRRRGVRPPRLRVQ